MVDRRTRRSQKAGAFLPVEALESRTLFSATFATLVLDAPRLPALPVQVDRSAPGTPAAPGATLDSALDLQVRVLAAGINLTVAASSTELMALAPSGTVDLYDDRQYLGTVSLGGSVRSTLVLPAGKHTFYVTYAGDANFRPSQTSLTTTLPVPTATLPEVAANADVYATNDTGERIRASRFLSNINFFDASSLSVGALPPVPGGASGPSSGGFSLASSNPVPTPRFSKITFSLKLPKLSGH